jgi:cytochrome c oxidase assembly protein subunit 15
VGVTVPDLSPRVRTFAWASLVANIVIVVTGGAVRLTGSGLGCPTWPRCTDRSFTPHGALSIHQAIEFGNRTLTFGLIVVAVLTLGVAWQTGRRELRTLALVMAAGIPAQIVIGGITVRTHLNPWVVSLHLLCSLTIIAVSVLFLWRIGHPDGVAVRDRRTLLAALVAAAGTAVLYVGTVVTGSGPHAGDRKVPRNGLDPLQLSQVHADLVFLLVGLTVALVLVAPAGARRAATCLLGIELSQGLIGFVQYFTGLPVVLVGFHVLGAALIAAALAWTVLAVRERAAGSAAL